MKNALILHGTNAKAADNWFPWLKTELEKRGYQVWVPDLPGAEKPNIERYNDFILRNADWEFNDESVIIGHSSGAVAILGFLPALPAETKINTCILVGSFKDDLGWDSLKEMFIKPLDFKAAGKHARKFVFLHSDNDPYCPLEHAEFLTEKVGGKLIVKNGAGHFSGAHVTIPEILDELP